MLRQMETDIGVADRIPGQRALTVRPVEPRRIGLEAHVSILCCPSCQGDLVQSSESLTCVACMRRFTVDGGIPLLFWPTEGCNGSNRDVTDVVKSFYEQTPFPNYDGFDNTDSLLEKARRAVFPRMLDEQIPFNSRVLEVGCGTGQLSVFLSVAHRTVFGTDMCLNSLRLGQAFKEHNGLTRVNFVQMNLFRPVFKPGSFHLVISNGVLHHTADPRLAFSTIAKLVRPGGYIVVGLYHRYGRIITDVRRWVFRRFGDHFAALDPNLRASGKTGAKRRAWFMDQYCHPHESKHSIDEVLGWVRSNGLEFVRSVPHSTPFHRFSVNDQLFEPARPGNAAEHLMVELPMMFKGSKEGGFFIVIARKPLRHASGREAYRDRSSNGGA
jgi:SAM-dependent methyltransferase